MSILDALRVQKSGQKSVQELSQLPQQEIMQMAQMGQIPADVVPVIISEKARLAQQAAQAQAMQNPRPPSVMDQAMQVNAQHEQQGLPAIPTPGMFKEQNYQSGGIVGYAGDGTEGQQVKGYEPDEINALADGGLGKYVQQALAQQRAINAAPIATSKAEQDYSSMLRSPPADENKMMWMSLLKGGLKTLGGASPHAGVNLGQGLGEAAQSYEEGLKEQQKQKLAYAKEMADQARAQRQEGLGALTLGAKLMESENTLQAALARAAKEGDMNTFIRIAVTAARERGDKTPDSILAETAAQNFIKLKAALDPRMMAASAAEKGAGAQVVQAEVAGKKQKSEEEIRREDLQRKIADENDKNRRDAAKNVNTMLADPDTELRKRIRKEGRDKVKEDLLKQELGLYGLAPPGRTPPPSGFQPKGSGQLPPGFQLIK